VAEPPCAFAEPSRNCRAVIRPAALLPFLVLFLAPLALTVRSHDKVRVMLDGKLLIDAWEPDGSGEATGSIRLVAGRTYELTVQYVKSSDAPSASLGYLRYYRGELNEALVDLRRAYDLYNAIGNAAGRQQALENIAHVYADSRVGQYDRAIEYYRQLLPSTRPRARRRASPTRSSTSAARTSRRAIGRPRSPGSAARWKPKRNSGGATTRRS
jgi:tetratricopeptide (TPR) repeat protein